MTESRTARRRALAALCVLAAGIPAADTIAAGAVATAGADSATALAAMDSAGAATMTAAPVILTDPALLDSAEVILDFVSIDSSLWAGEGVFLAFEDTIPFTEGTLDTIYASAPRITVAEVVRRIGERMESERARIREHSYTGLTKVIATFAADPGRTPKRQIFEAGERMRLDRSGTYQQVTLWRRERTFEDGELEKEKVEDEIEVDWQDLGGQVRAAIPFSLESGDEYNYEILARKLVGTNVIYEVRYTPKSRFKGQTSGVVWVDYGEFVIRRLDGEVIDSPPVPMFIESIPDFRLRFAQRGEFWVLDDFYARIELRDIPFLGVPETVELYYWTRGHVINGEASGPDVGEAPPPAVVAADSALAADVAAAAPADAYPGGAGAADPRAGAGAPAFDLAGGAVAARAAGRSDLDVWISEEAAAESLAVFWNELDAGWDEAIGPELFEFGLAETTIDSLSDVGDGRVADMLAGKVWKLSLDPVGRLAFNRVEGWRPGLRLGVRRLGILQPELHLAAGYGIAGERVLGDARLVVPLLRHQPLRQDGLPAGLGYARLEAELHGAKWVRSYAGDDRAERSLVAIFTGNDPNHYYESSGGGLTLRYRPARWLTFSAGALLEEHTALPVATRWSLAGDRDEVDENLQVPALRTRAATLGARLDWRRWSLRTEAQLHRVDETAFFGADRDSRDLLLLAASLRGRLLDRHGNELVLRGGWRAWDRRAPLQWKTWLGDWPTLRGYEIQELAGDRALWGSADVRWGFDLFESLRIPLLGKLGLQPLTFVDAGWTRCLQESADAPWRDGFRMDAGLGVGKLIGGPGIGGHLRLYAGRPVFDGQEDRAWRFLLVVER